MLWSKTLQRHSPWRLRRPCSARLGFQKTNEKTSNRIPFPVFASSRVEMRYVPEERPGKTQKLRLERFSAPATARPVWVRGQLASVQCPKSIITADSLSFLEQF